MGEKSMKDLVRLIVTLNISFRMVDSPEFKIYCAGLNSSIRIPCRQTVRKEILKEYKLYASKLGEIIRTIPSVALTTDTWTSRANRSYNVLTMHYIDPITFKLESLILDFAFFPTPHTGEYVAEYLWSICHFHGMLEKLQSITTDNGPNVVLGMKLFKDKLLDKKKIRVVHIRCIAHTLNVVVSKGFEEFDPLLLKVRNLVIQVKNSPKQWETFQRYCKEVDIQPMPLLLDVATRWNSTFVMLERAIMLAPAITEYTEREKLDFITEGEWENLKDLKTLLEPIWKATFDLSGQKYVSISLILPAITFIISGII